MTSRSNLAGIVTPEVQDGLDRLFLRRGRFLMLLTIGAVIVFVAANHLMGSAQWWSDGMNLSVAALLGLVMFSTRLPLVQRYMVEICLLLAAVLGAVRALAGIWHGDVTATATFIVAMAIMMAATLPWGLWRQFGVACALGCALAVNWHMVASGFGPESGRAAANVVLGLGGSVILAAETRRHHTRLLVDNLRRRDAEAALARLNAELEHRVDERTAQLTAATRALEREAHERRQTEAELRESQRRLQAVLDHAGVAIYLRDLDGRYLLVNRYWLRLAGRTAEEVIGHTIDEIMPADIAATFHAHDEEVLRGSDSRQFEESMPLPDGWHTFVSVRFPWLDTDGRPAGIWGLATDITDRKEAEAELRRSEAALSAVIENTSDAIWSIDRSGAVAVINAAARARFERHFGLPYASESARNVQHDLLDDFASLHARALAGEPVHFELSHVEADGTHHTLNSLHPIVERGEIIGVTGSSKDITELKRAQQTALQHQADLAHVLRLGTMGEMNAGLAHEINQPLGAIANYAQGCVHRLRARSIDADSLLPIIEQIAAEALRAGEIIRRLRDWLRKEGSRKAPADLNHLVRESVRLIEPEARARNVVLQVDLAPTLPVVSCNDIQIEQVLLNLLLNGVEAVEAAENSHRTLSVRTTLASDTIEVAVCDSGVGLPEPPDDVFTPFFTTKANGLGMGLSISRSIIEAHGGRLWSTRNPERGATLHFTLPA
jgi:PAS domain S-box-containing protein